MTRRMLAEERELKKLIATYARGDMFDKDGKEVPLKGHFLRLITRLVKAVREDCAKVARGKNDACGKCAEEIAAAIMRRK